MIAVVGLGNPDRKYEKNRHNLGIVVVKSLAKRLNLDLKGTKHIPALFAKTDQCLLVAPLTYVNESGTAVAEILRKHNIKVNDIWVIHDDTEIPFGEIRIKNGGTSGGHNGIRSIDNSIGAEYWRVRFGVGRPENRASDLADYVLSDFTSEEREVLPAIIDRLTDFLIQSLQDKQLLPNTFNGATKNN